MNKNLNLIEYFKKAVSEKDWLVLLTLALGFINIPIALTGFTNGIFSAAFGFVVAFFAMASLDKTKNSLAILGGILGFIGTAIGVFIIFITYIKE
ncbi:MAG: hypothetical protein IJM37_00915 [Lachnospiraceae bacterium]|nr:hypothetical protein [Lachnospiraceae bacterium]